jgi:ubiquinone/menaquinone biosynthesis C-methylase UbiE
MALYDAIGRTYDTTRKADPNLTRCLTRHLNFTPGARYLDIGCGTGNYTVALQQLGARMHGLELTSTMLAKARRKSDRVRWIQGNAESLPFPDRCFDGAMGTFTLHHMKHPERAIEEAFRVIDYGRFVIFTADLPQSSGYWLNEYFPVGMAAMHKQMPPAANLVRHLEHAGFTAIEQEPWEIPEDIQDWFLYAGKRRPEIYLDPAVRAGISTFAQGLISAEETIQGCARLEADIKSGRFEEVAAKYHHDRGDCLFIVATKT